MSVLLQISDPHFGTEQAPVVEALLKFAHRQRPDVVVVSGDITQRARPKQFANARAFVDRLGSRVIAIPGNHDIPLFDLVARFTQPYARHCAMFGDDLEPMYETDDMLVMCLNTTRPRRHKHGELSETQIVRVAGRLANAKPEQLRVIVLHHPIAVRRAEDEVDRVHHHQAALRHWGLAGADLILGGHIHLPYVMPLDDYARPMWAVQAGTALSSRTRDGIANSVNLIRWGEAAAGGRCVIERWDYAANEGAFTMAMVTEVQPLRDGVPVPISALRGRSTIEPSPMLRSTPNVASAPLWSSAHSASPSHASHSHDLPSHNAPSRRG